MHRFQVVTDNFYTGIKLAYALLERNTFTLGTIQPSRVDLPEDLFRVSKKKRVNRFCTRFCSFHHILCDTLFQRQFSADLQRGHCVFRYSTCGRIFLVSWRDNKIVHVICTDPRYGRTLKNVSRRDRKFETPNKSKPVPQPVIIERYIKWMRGVDLA